MKSRFLLGFTLALCGLMGGVVHTAPAHAQDTKITARPARPPQITVCVIDVKAENNPTYLGLATTLTRMKCEIPDTQDKVLTLGSLYLNGWRLVQVVGEGWLANTGGQKPNSPVYYLERGPR